VENAQAKEYNVIRDYSITAAPKYSLKDRELFT
jgi:hypothetical protein